MNTAANAFYFDPDAKPTLITVGKWSTGDSFYHPAFASPHPEAPHIVYRIMLRTGVRHDDVADRLAAFIDGHPELSFRDCMVHPLLSVEGRDSDCCSAQRAEPSYASLKRVLDAAYAQSAEGKGRERHGNGLDFDQQPIMKIGRMVGAGYPVGQAMKKGQEAIGMARRGEHDAAKAELLGVIVYAAAAYLLLEEAD